VAGSTRPPSLPEPGDVLAGKYKIERLIGSGGMGAVFRAHHQILDQPVAIKLLLPESASRAEAIGRFLNEARAAARIRSEHVAAVLDVGRLEDGLAYIVLEYLEGMDLAQLLEQRETLAVHEAVDIVLEALEAVAQAHTLGIVHRDLKPANLFLARRPDGSITVKVLDFGISKVTAGGESMDVTSSQATLGSPSYMSPEQVRSSKSVDVRSDLWSIGVILYRALTGRPAFGGDSVGAVFAAILETTPRPLSQRRPDVPQGLSDVVARCLERDRERRHRNVAELAGKLEPFASRKGRRAVENVLRTMRVPGASGSYAAATGSEPPPRAIVTQQSVPPPGALSDTVAVADPSGSEPGPSQEGPQASRPGAVASSSPGTGPTGEATASPWIGPEATRPVRRRLAPLVIVVALLVAGVVVVARLGRQAPVAGASATGTSGVVAPAAPVVLSPSARGEGPPVAPAASSVDLQPALPSSAHPSPAPNRPVVRPTGAPRSPVASARPHPTASTPQSPFDEQGLDNRR